MLLTFFSIALGDYMRRIIMLVLLLICVGLWSKTPMPEYTIKLEWDEMSGELNGILSANLNGEIAYIQGISRSIGLGGMIASLGESTIDGASQAFDIYSKEGFFSFWIRDKFADDDVNPDMSLIKAAKPRVSVFKGNQLLRSFNIDRGMGLTCKVFTLDAATSFIDQEIRFYPRTKVVLVQIVNALDGNPVPDVDIAITGGDEHYQPLKTDSDGFAYFPLEIGSYILSISKPGFISSSYPVKMGFDENPIEYVIALSPEVREYRIVLTWGSRPLDLDAHLTGPKPEGGNFHIWYRNRIPIGGRDFLDRDDTDGYGPETITIYKPAPGEYVYSVHDYSNRQNSASKGLSRSGATVQVYAQNRLLKTFSIPEGQNGTLWKVFKIDLNGNIKPINTVSWIQNERDIR